MSWTVVGTRLHGWAWLESTVGVCLTMHSARALAQSGRKITSKEQLLNKSKWNARVPPLTFLLITVSDNAIMTSRLILQTLEGNGDRWGRKGPAFSAISLRHVWIGLVLMLDSITTWLRVQPSKVYSLGYVLKIRWPIREDAEGKPKYNFDRKWKQKNKGERERKKERGRGLRYRGM